MPGSPSSATITAASATRTHSVTMRSPVGSSKRAISMRLRRIRTHIVM